jgi:hypothetical protein
MEREFKATKIIYNVLVFCNQCMCSQTLPLKEKCNLVLTPVILAIWEVEIRRIASTGK